MNTKIPKTPQWSRESLLHYNMSSLGGFLGAYALLLRGGNFGNAQTGNLLELVIDLTQFRWGDFLARLGALAIFALSLALSTYLRGHTRLPMRWLTLAVEGLGLAMAALLPSEGDPVVMLYPIFFISSFQWGSFSGTERFSSASVFSTNNLRQCVAGWVEYALERDPVQRQKGIFYALTLLLFALGGLAGALLAARFGPVSALFGLIPLATGWGLAGRT